MKVYIVEDDFFHLHDIKITLKELGFQCLGHSDDPFEAQEQIAELRPDVILVDINLNNRKSGIALAKRIKDLYGIPIIFISSEIENDIIIQAADAEPVSYITKPITKNDLNAAILLAESKLEKKTQEVKNEHSITEEEIFIKNGSKLTKVSFSSIVYAHTDTKNYCTIVTEENRTFTIRNSVLGLAKFLNHSSFIQTHRSYIINWKKIDTLYEKDQTVLVGGHSIPIGRAYKKEVYKRLRIL